MAKKYDALSKSKIISGLRCTKKLWFDVHEPIKFEKKSTIERGKRFGKEVIKNYTKGNGKFLDLTDVWANRVNRTKQAINSDDINVIFEGALDIQSWFAVTVIVISTLLNTAYFLPIVYVAFFRNSNTKNVCTYNEAPFPIVLAVSITALMTVILFFFPEVPLQLVKLLIGEGL